MKQTAPQGAGEETIIGARDGWPLAATVWPAGGGGVVVVNAATGVPRGYYRGFADYAASRGLNVITYDYRGIGGSMDGRPLTRVRATMRDWAVLDAAAVMDWALRRFPGRALLALGHSFGGQCLGLLPQAGRLERVALVASQLGYWRNFARRDQPPAWFAMHAMLPVLSRALGYFPSSKVGLGEDLPKGVALEWARWCRSPRYLFDHLSDAERMGYVRVTAPLLSYKVTDDTFASAESVEKLLPYYPSAKRLLRTVGPQEVGVKTLGHFGPFRSAAREVIWPELADWLLDGKAPAAARPVEG